MLQPYEGWSNFQRSMRSDTNQFEDVVSNLSVDEHKVTTQVTIATVLEFTLHWMIHVASRQYCIAGE